MHLTKKQEQKLFARIRRFIYFAVMAVVGGVISHYTPTELLPLWFVVSITIGFTIQEIIHYKKHDRLK